MKHSYSTGQWQYPMYNALGQRVQDYQGIDPMTLTYPIDIFGQRTGTFAQWPSHSWTGWNVYWASVAGQRLNMGGADAYIDHADVIGSTTMETDPAGGVQWKIAYYPWGQVLAQGGIRQSVVWAGLDWQVNDPSYPSATREYNDGVARWMTPDPDNAGADASDPQSWDMYSYVGNNPITRTDPSGEDYRVCVNNGDQEECTGVQNEAAFQSALANPGAGITIEGDTGSGTIYGTSASGQQVQVGTYEEVAGPGTEGGGLQNDIGADLSIAGGIAAGVQTAAGLAEAGVNAIERMLGVGTGEATSVVTTSTGAEGAASVDQVVTKAISAVGNQPVRVASEQEARQAAEKFLGPGKIPALDRNTGVQVGWKSADGTKVVIGPHTDLIGPHYNFKNLLIGGNLHVRW